MLTQVRGVYCSLCHVRYVYHVCRDGMPCMHEYAEPARGGVRAPATLIYCYAWKHKECFRRFELHKFHIIHHKDGSTEKKFFDSFTARYVDEESLVDKFLMFLKNTPVVEWPVWTEAFRSLFYGGSGLRYPPRWRERQIQRIGWRNIINPEGVSEEVKF